MVKKGKLAKETSANETVSNNLRSQLRFSSETGEIWLHEHRMLLVHADSHAKLRRELIESLGIGRARGMIMRIGYATGINDCELTHINRDWTNDYESFMAGPLLFTLEGNAKTSIPKLEINRKMGKFYVEALLENSWESQAYLRHYGESAEGVCWYLHGYSSGYCSAFMGKPILCKEVKCFAAGGKHCYLVGKPVEEWDDSSDYSLMLNQESIVDQLIGLQNEVVHLRSAISEKKMPSDVVGNSPAFLAAYDLLMQAVDSQITVLLLGETGVGKEVFARTLHEKGARCKESFIAINCAAIPHDLVESELFGVEKGAFTGALASRPGRFERANGGTLFLDEVGDLPLSAQAKLLRVLQEGEVERLGGTKTHKVNVRLVAATNIDLRQLVENGKFRSDLYYRLNALQIHIPPLKERKLDILILAKTFLKKFSDVNGKKLRGFSDKAKLALLAYQWPGNIRELQNVVERGVMLAPNGTHISIQHMFPSYSSEFSELALNAKGGLSDSQKESGKDFCEAILSGRITLEQANTLLAEAAVEKASGNLSAAARMLGLTRPQLAYRLEHRPENAVMKFSSRKPKTRAS
ncbi:aromatic catabolism-like sigma-54-dependent transcriptional regulator, XylR and V4R domain-containing [Geotalea daltonii FRC-32]|uniref:Aromatic catabolism-like sigma-54-dependent transcriptional regulator, XylR and V4R domain-containing n=1 Tax=Geotalea daltonii (strain DSM 22248 / JCM 15807 / FRC-32) TaxID=316067 RepID=B9M024_GEODF|nr:sigma-54-dependent Fis family transcriptional regulator [Geotalea daltonii]ACM20804.1 aromatic catabolism-like sigma-54-dependent transcriptional regulator, XylR and V4R domain-containing [Geotalea daltonii FRC-32]